MFFYLSPIFLLLLKGLHQVNDSLLDLFLRSRDEDMLESTSLLPSQGPFYLNPVAITISVGEAEKDHIGLFSEEFWFLCGVS